MPDVAFVVPRSAAPLAGLVAALRSELERQGMPSSVHESFPEPDPARLFVLVAPRRFVAERGSAALPDDPVLARTAFLEADDGSSAAAEAHRALLRRAGRIFELNQSAVTALHVAGVSSRLLRPGYCPEWDRYAADAEREIDIAVVAEHSARRTRQLSDAADVLARHRCAVHVVDPLEIDPDDRRELFSRAKVALISHHGTETQLDWLTALDAMHGGAVVVAEQASGIAPFEAGRHLIVAGRDALGWVADALLDDDERLRATREDAYRRLRDWLPFAASVAVFRAGILELLGRPLGDAAGTGAPVSVTQADASAHPDRESSDVAADRARTRRELVEVRRELGRLQRVVGSATTNGDSDEDAAPELNDAWAQATPAVSVLLAADADERRLLRTLDSLDATRDQLEVVISGSDEELAGVRKRMTADGAPPAALVGVAAGAVPGVRLNRALTVARAPLCLLVETGVALYPRCLPALRAVIELDPAPAFAYPIAAVRGESDRYREAGGDWLEGLVEPDPARLRSGNPVGPLALVRTTALTGAGGLSEAVLLDGLELYDLWCRLAERGAEGRLLPEILCWRPVADSADRLALRRPWPGAATAALVQRAPRVLAGAYEL